MIIHANLHLPGSFKLPGRFPLSPALHNLLRGALILLLPITLAVGCGSDQVGATEEQQILTLVENFYVRDEGDVPEYEATLEEVEGDWARVSIVPEGVEVDQPDIVYLQKQPNLASEALSVTPAATPGQSDSNPIATESGWVLMVGPQATFTDEELNSRGVPQEIRP